MNDSDPRTDDELVAAADDGDTSAFDALYRRHRDWVVHLAYRFVGDRDESLDVLQDTFAYFLRKFPGFRLTAKLTTFLYPVVKNLALASLRKRGRHLSDVDMLHAIPAPEDPPAASRPELASALATLPQPQLETLLMRYVDGMSMAEIASALSIPVGTVKSRLHHALSALRHDKRTREYFEP
ncbi:MAG: sigma-70 family RNA polymerase sigma factor [bacterium]|nr:sigma-70 family RNA polymerase sigma factor [bacterium]